MEHEIHWIRTAEVTGPHRIRVRFEDNTEQLIDLEPVLHGDLLGALRDPDFFRRMRLDEEVGTVVWPNGADFDPAILYHWPRHRDALAAKAKQWALARA